MARESRRRVVHEDDHAVVVGTDFETGSQMALERAQQLAHDMASRLYVVHVVSEAAMMPTTPLPDQWKTVTGPTTRPRTGTGVRAAVALAERRLVSAPTFVDGAVAENVVRAGRPHEVLAEFADMRNARVLVLGVHRPLGEYASFFLGSTSERALRHGSTPVLLARTRVAGPYRSVLVPVDLEEPMLSRRLLDVVQTLTPYADYDVVHFIPATGERGERSRARREDATGRLRDLCESAGLDPRRTTVHATFGAKPREGILGEVKTRRPDLIAMGTHARSGLARVFLGSVADYVIHTAWTVDVLAVPPLRPVAAPKPRRNRDAVSLAARRRRISQTRSAIRARDA
jgi:universal stress protein E